MEEQTYQQENKIGRAHQCESDGMNYTSYPPQWKCKICGKFEYIHKANMTPYVPDYMK